MYGSATDEWRKDISPCRVFSEPSFLLSCKLELGTAEKDSNGAELAGRISTSSATNSGGGVASGSNVPRASRGQSAGHSTTGWSMW